MPKSLGWKRFDHYSIAVPDREKAIAFHEKLFGLETNHRFDTPAEGFRGAVLDMPKKQGQIEILPGIADAGRVLVQRRQLVFVHHVRVVEEAPDQGGFAIVDRPAGEEPQEVLALVIGQVGLDVGCDELGLMRHQKYPSRFFSSIDPDWS